MSLVAREGDIGQHRHRQRTQHDRAVVDERAELPEAGLQRQPEPDEQQHHEGRHPADEPQQLPPRERALAVHRLTGARARGRRGTARPG